MPHMQDYETPQDGVTSAGDGTGQLNRRTQVPEKQPPAARVCWIRPEDIRIPGSWLA